jgi:hypothetical protein
VGGGLIFVAVFLWDVVFFDFAGADFALIGFAGVLDAVHHFGLEGLTFFQQSFYAFGIHVGSSAEALSIA